jgi:hypothetical protein
VKRFLREVARTIGRLSGRRTGRPSPGTATTATPTPAVPARTRAAGTKAAQVTKSAQGVKVTKSAQAVKVTKSAQAVKVTKAVKGPKAPRALNAVQASKATGATGAAAKAPRTGTAPAKSAPAGRPPTKASTALPTREAERHRLVYAPQPDGEADPGEVVWTWVAYEDDPSQGKDRPVLVVGRDGAFVLGLMLSSQTDRDGQPHWLGLGPGAWDRQDRPSWVRLDRVLQVPEDGIRREGAVLDRARFERIAAALRREYGWR